MVFSLNKGKLNWQLINGMANSSTWKLKVFGNKNQCCCFFCCNIITFVCSLLTSLTGPFYRLQQLLSLILTQFFAFDECKGVTCFPDNSSLGVLVWHGWKKLKRDEIWDGSLADYWKKVEQLHVLILIYNRSNSTCHLVVICSSFLLFGNRTFYSYIFSMDKNNVGIQ